jgi:excisionase family DNA binding protein
MLQNLLRGIDQNRESITTAQAAKRSDLSQVYLAQLLRENKLEGFQLGRDWYVYTDSLEAFLQQKRKPGPKGPRKKPTQARSDVQNNDLPGSS